MKNYYQIVNNLSKNEEENVLENGPSSKIHRIPQSEVVFVLVINLPGCHAICYASSYESGEESILFRILLLSMDCASQKCLLLKDEDNSLKPSQGLDIVI